MKKRVLVFLLTLALAVAMVIPMAIPVGAVIAPQLAARWPFNEESGATTVADISGNGNTGTIYGATPGAAGKFGNALSFDGNDYVSVPDSPFLTCHNLTVEAWIKGNSFTSNPVIVSKVEGTAGNQPGWKGFYLQIWNSKVTLAIDGNVWFSGSTSLLPNIWYQVAGTYDGTTMKVYLNGALDGTYTSSSGISDTAAAVTIGNFSLYNRFMDGSIDEVRIWSSVLTADQLDDMLPPIVTSENDGDIYLLNQTVTTSSDATDDDTGLGDGSGVTGADLTTLNPANGSLVDTSAVGSHSFNITCNDYAKNSATITVTYYVIGFSGFLPPVVDGRVFKLGSTIPVKFQLTDASGNFITDATATIKVQMLENGIPVGSVEEGDSTSTATIGNLFRYDLTSNQYIFNLATKSLSAGTWRITITVNGSGSAYVGIGLK